MKTQINFLYFFDCGKYCNIDVCISFESVTNEMGLNESDFTYEPHINLTDTGIFLNFPKK